MIVDLVTIKIDIFCSDYNERLSLYLIRPPPFWQPISGNLSNFVAISALGIIFWNNCLQLGPILDYTLM